MENLELGNLEKLQIPVAVKKDLELYSKKILEIFKDRIASITIIGSATTPDFSEETSDINLLVIFSTLELADLKMILPEAAQWQRQRQFTPRFISRRNLISSLEYLPIDWWTMKAAHCVIFGEDILKEVNIQKKDLLWQLRHEIKGLRMRIKQQFWRTGQNPKSAEKCILADFNTILFHLKVLCYFKNMPIPDTIGALLGNAESEFKIDGAFTESLLKLKQGKIKLDKKNIFPLFECLFNLIRRVDDLASEIKI